MPCYATGSAEGDARLDAHESAQEVTYLTRMLCAVCSNLELPTVKGLSYLSLEGQAWWKEHKLIDAERVQEEKDREQEKALAVKARSRLTNEEYEALRRSK